MIAIVLEQLKSIKNPISDNLLSIFEGTQEKVSDGYYSSTVFQTKEKYRNDMSLCNSKIVGVFNKTIIETPLIFIKSNFPCIFSSRENQGISFGVTMIDYVSKKPYIVAVVNKSSSYVFKALVYDLKTKTYKETSSEFNCENVDELFNNFQSNLSTLINEFKK